MNLSQSFVLIKFVSNLLNQYESFSYSLTFIDGMSTYFMVKSMYYFYHPYIIKFLSPTYVPIEVVVEFKN